MSASFERRFSGVKGWALFGAAFLVFDAYLITMWITSGQAKPTPPGPTPIPDWMRVEMMASQILSPIAGLIFFYFVVIRPWRRTGHLSLAGMFTIACTTLMIQDTWMNYSQTFVNYNSYFANLGVWNAHVPGWLSPNGNLQPEPYLLGWPMYVYLVMGWILVGAWLMRRAQARWPQLGRLGLFLIAWATVAVMDTFFEPIMMRLGWWAYGGGQGRLTINSGKYYQFPLYEGLTFGLAGAIWCSLYYFKNDKGETLAERGANRLRMSSKRKNGVRLLAIVGVVNAAYIVGYNIPIQYFGLHASSWPEDITSRSYFVNGFCDAGTTYACSGASIPIPRPGSARVGPDGGLVPAGASRCASDASAEQVPHCGSRAKQGG
jgi:hypothetical protein